MARGPAILTADETRAAEQRIFDAGVPVIDLMELAGKAVADAVCRYHAPTDTLLLAGPGNNGGDAYVVARLLMERGWPVRLAALAPPRTEAAQIAAQRFGGTVEPLDDCLPASLLIDGLFGTGLTRALDPMPQHRLSALVNAARFSVAIDLPSGIATDDGAVMGDVPAFDLTIALGCVKPAHVLQPGASRCGVVRVGEIGLAASSDCHLLARPAIHAPDADSHKYRRGYALIVGGAMPGAACLSAQAAARSGAGYIRLISDTSATSPLPDAIIQTLADDLAPWLADNRLGAVLAGPGLGRDARARERVAQLLTSPRKLVLDADALMVMTPSDFPKLVSRQAILTPHEGEFSGLFGLMHGSKVARCRAAAKQSGAVVLLKGADTVIAAPDGRAVVAPSSSHWLSTAGTGDVLAGLCVGLLATGLDPFDAACTAQYLHSEAARQAGPVLIADDLITALPRAITRCLTR